MKAIKQPSSYWQAQVKRILKGMGVDYENACALHIAIQELVIAAKSEGYNECERNMWK